MIYIIAKNTVIPEKKAAFLEAVKPLIAGSQAEEGNISYDLFEDLSNPNVLTFIERWKDQDAINCHNSTPHFTEIVPKLAEFLAGDNDVTLYKQV